jgi:hypothetical protein
MTVSLQTRIAQFSRASDAIPYKPEVVSRALNRVRKAVVDGQTMGNPYIDVIVYGLGAPDQQELERYKAVNLKLKGNSGKPILFYRTVEEPSPRMHASPRRVRSFFIGILNGEELIVDRTSNPPSIGIPFSSYRDERLNHSFRRFEKIHTGVLTERPFWLTKMNNLVFNPEDFFTEFDSVSRLLYLSLINTDGDSESVVNQFLEEKLGWVNFSNEQADPGSL